MRMGEVEEKDINGSLTLDKIVRYRVVLCSLPGWTSYQPVPTYVVGGILSISRT